MFGACQGEPSPSRSHEHAFFDELEDSLAKSLVVVRLAGHAERSCDVVQEQGLASLGEKLEDMRA